MRGQSLATQFDLNEREVRLVSALVSAPGISPKDAMLQAGYAPSSAESYFYGVTRKPAFLAALHLETQRRVQRLAPCSLETVRSIEAGTITEGAKVRLDAAKTILAIAGHIAPRARAPGDGTEKTLAEMSLDELKATQDRLQAEILNRAKPVNAQETVPSETSDVDLLG